MSEQATKILIESLDHMQQWGKTFASQIDLPCCIYLIGDLGAGKTTLAQSIIAGLGYQGAVTSPTYTLVQEYATDTVLVQHLDLYRLKEPEELEFLGLIDLWHENSLFIVEWPDKGQGILQTPDITIEIQMTGDHCREITLTR